MYNYISNMVLSLIKPLSIKTFGFSNGASTPQENAFLHQQQNIQKQVDLLKIHGGSKKKNKTLKMKRVMKKRKKNKKGGNKTKKLSDSGRKRLKNFSSNLLNFNNIKPRVLFQSGENILKKMDKDVKKYTERNLSFGGKKHMKKRTMKKKSKHQRRK